jgi:putative membrane protein
MRPLRSFALAMLVSVLLRAHEGAPLEPHDFWYAWPKDPIVIAGLVLSGWMFAAGARKSRGILFHERASYWTGLLFLAIAVASPLHPLGEVLFSMHMLQHEVLMVIAAPLLVLGRPLTPYLWALPARARRPVGRLFLYRPLQILWRFFSAPLHAWGLHFAVLWLWHIPGFFEASVKNPGIHAFQHVSFFGSALLFWWSLFGRQGAEKRYGAGAFYVFTTMVHTGILGAMLTFSTSPWYTVYTGTTQAWGLTPIEDQQLGGLIMTVPPIAIYLAAFLVLFGLWVRNANNRRAEYVQVENRL